MENIMALPSIDAPTYEIKILKRLRSSDRS